MHLCDDCAGSRDWASDPIVRTKTRLQAGADEPRKVRCGTCRGVLPHALFKLCGSCASRSALCQHCGKSTLTPERQEDLRRKAEAKERFQELLDLFTCSRKIFGIARTRELFATHREALGAEMVDRALGLNADALENEPERRKRPIWTRVYGTLRFGTPPPRCDGCAPLRTPRYCRASECGHWTVGLAARWCFPCAVERGQCATCSIPTVEASPE